MIGTFMSIFNLMRMLEVIKNDFENFESILKCWDSLQHLLTFEEVSKELFEVKWLQLIFAFIWNH